MGHKPDYTIDWKAYYQSRTMAAEQAIALVKPGDSVSFPRGREPEALGLALAARRGEFKGMKVMIPQPGRDFGWFDAGWEESFAIRVGFVSDIARPALEQGRIEFQVFSDLAEDSADFGAHLGRTADVLLVEVSSPDERGFCSFGASLWDKKEAVQGSRLVLAEVNPTLIRTYGDNFVHVTEMDAFVVNRAPTGWGPAIGRRVEEPPAHVKEIARYVSQVVRDGDTMQIGLGKTTELLTRVDTFDHKADLGLHSEITPRRTAQLVKAGVINGKRKSAHPGVCIVTAAGGSREDVAFIDNNPLFELYSVRYVVNPVTISKNDNMVAINQALAMDLTGQITAESLGTLQYSTPGGQPIFAMGALMAKGGRSIHVLPSTAANGKVSRIVPTLPEGTAVTIPRYLADIVVTEYGVAHLRWKTTRERAQELLKVAHPDFRKELERAARHRFWPK